MAISTPSRHAPCRHSAVVRLLLALPAALLGACQTPVPRDSAAAAREITVSDDTAIRSEYTAGPRGGKTYVIDAAGSRLLIYAYRGAAAATLGHNHVLRAAQIDGYVHMPASAPAGARFDLRVPLAQLVIDEPQLRAATGDAFAGERSASDIAGTRHNLLGPTGLDAARYPDVRVHSTQVSGDWPALVADIEISLHGVTRSLSVPLMAHRDGDRMRITGALALRQSDFAITPYSALLGLLAVQDAVTISVDVLAHELR